MLYRSCYFRDTRLKVFCDVLPSLNSPFGYNQSCKSCNYFGSSGNVKDTVSRFVSASSSVFQGESEAQTSSKYVKGCHSRASVAAADMTVFALFRFVPLAWQLPPDPAVLSRGHPVSNVT